MVDQATVRSGKPAVGDQGDARSNGSPEGRVVGGIAELANNIANLAELQIKLAKADLKESTERAFIPLVLIVVGLVFILSAVPVMLFGVAELVAFALKFSRGWSLILTSGATLVAAAVVVGVASLKLSPSLSSFSRSSEELTRNIAWIRTVLLYSGRSLPTRSR